MRVRFLIGGDAGQEINLPYREAMASILNGAAESIEQAASRPIPSPAILDKPSEQSQKKKRERR